MRILSYFLENRTIIMKVSLIHPATFKLDGGAMFGIIPKPLWQKKIMPDELNRILMSLRVVLIETKNKKILVDTGIGDYHNDKFKDQFEITSDQSPLETALKKHKNIQPEDITDIIITHLHFDHVGGLGKGLDSKELVFPNATIHLHQKHFEYAQNPTIRDQGSFQDYFFLPLLKRYLDKNQINFLDGNEEGFILKDGEDEINFKVSFGHTPYMIHPYFKDYIYMADLVPMSHHIRIPWVMGYDIEPGTTTIYKEKFYKFIMDKNLKMIFEHDIETWGGKLIINEKKQYELEMPLKTDGSQVQLL